MSYGLYNIETKILSIKPELYSNSQPHRPKLNPLLAKTLSLFTKTSTVYPFRIPSEILDKLTFKSFYQFLLKSDPNPIPITNTITPPYLATSYSCETPTVSLLKS